MPDDGIAGLGQKLSELLRLSSQPDGSRWTDDALAKAVQARGVQTTRASITLMRQGKRNNPSARLLNAIADVCGVPLAYFLDPEREERVVQQLEALQLIKDAKLKGVLTRAAGMTPDMLDAVMAVMDTLKDVQGKSK